MRVSSLFHGFRLGGNREASSSGNFLANSSAISCFVPLGLPSSKLLACVPEMSFTVIYNWRLSTAANPSAVVQSAQTTAASNTFTGLTPGVVYNVEANAVGAAGPSDWSAPVPQMAV